MRYKPDSKKIMTSRAFTIVELLVVIVVIAILAAITIVSYRGITKHAAESVMKSDLSSAYESLESFKVINDTYPSTIDCSESESSTSLCIQNNSSDITYTYVPSSDLSSYQLCTTSASQNENYCISSSNNTPTVTADADLPTATVAESCPTGFILVPGSSTYGTSDFCVMKYEAKKYSSTQPYSVASGTPWASITQTNAIAYSQNTVDQDGNSIEGAHLITEAEWMTIAQNVLGVVSNWSGMAVGSGFIYNGHENGDPSSGLDASSNDTDSNYGETTYNNASVSANNKRTLTLSNGGVIWDLAGNENEWTSSQITGSQPGLSNDSYYGWKNWNNNNLLQNGFPSKSMPSSMASGSLVNVTSWTTTNGIGALASNYNNTTTTVDFVRGGSYGGLGAFAGVLCLMLNTSHGSYSTSIGFRVVVPAQ